MKVTVVSIFDSASGCFSRPVFTTSPGTAVRSFKDEVNRVADSNEMNRHPKDFVLYHVADWDDVVGSFFCPEAGPARLVNASDLKEDGNV